MIIFILFITQIRLLLAQPISHKHCDIAYECVGTQWDFTGSSTVTTSARGYKSLSGPSTSITNEMFVFCSGDSSCAEILFISAGMSVFCEGSHSCSNIAGSSYIDASGIFCDGSNSCENSNMKSDSGVYCEGDQSCNYANISALRVYGRGSYSLYGATIDSNFITGSILDVYLTGYQAGFGGTIICSTGKICNIYCWFNACQMLYLICEDNNNCNIILNSNDPTITIPPITNKAYFDDSLLDIKYICGTSQIDSLCDDAYIYVYDNYQQQASVEMNINNGGPVCCRGEASCGHGEIHFTATIPDISVCSAASSCTETLITTAGPTFCKGDFSCGGSDIHGSNNVYCLGSFSCFYSVITSTQPTNVYCSGFASCVAAQVKSNGNDINIYLLGQHAGRELNIYCDRGDECVITCGAGLSCKSYGSNTTLHCNNNCLVFCNEDTGCPVGTYTKVPLPSGGSTCCVSDCSGLPNGNYQSCSNCNGYVACSNGYKFDMDCAPATPPLVWDDNTKACGYTSTTCPTIP